MWPATLHTNNLCVSGTGGDRVSTADDEAEQDGSDVAVCVFTKRALDLPQGELELRNPGLGSPKMYSFAIPVNTDVVARATQKNCPKQQTPLYK